MVEHVVERAVDHVKVFDDELTPRNHVVGDARQLLVVVGRAGVLLEARSQHDMRVMQRLLNLRQPQQARRRVAA